MKRHLPKFNPLLQQPKSCRLSGTSPKLQEASISKPRRGHRKMKVGSSLKHSKVSVILKYVIILVLIFMYVIFQS